MSDSLQPHGLQHSRPLCRSALSLCASNTAMTNLKKKDTEVLRAPHHVFFRGGGALGNVVGLLTAIMTGWGGRQGC